MAIKIVFVILAMFFLYFSGKKLANSTKILYLCKVKPLNFF